MMPVGSSRSTSLGNTNASEFQRTIQRMYQLVENAEASHGMSSGANESVKASDSDDGADNLLEVRHDVTPTGEPTGEAQRQDMHGSNANPSDNTTGLADAIGKLAALMDELRVTEDHDKTIKRAAAEVVDGKPSFAEGITLHTHDRPFTVRVLMQHIQTAISNLHPDKDTKGIELTKVSFVWDNNADIGWRQYHIQGRGEADEASQEDALVSDSLEAMMARGGQAYIYVKYRLDKVEHAEWCGPRMERVWPMVNLVKMCTNGEKPLCKENASSTTARIYTCMHAPLSDWIPYLHNAIV
ncbi:hypothetical protein SBOR_2480 [Sclerotinia borealis F-4128]|uniref:Uncharacterized protein n=1 Tax=Sclerotinia borealis (strain F-4128) TaxID=1432307 RepID=W9CJZ4_SCLBF|nr:hypothetical protein SBOR_2480 [Sclerotinia borealis F-4128]